MLTPSVLRSRDMCAGNLDLSKNPPVDAYVRYTRPS